ncbi:hypothetical protein [Actinoplanes sp. L3-i22]|uniref:hypothetical protein n=1 Tax=Actinoplanes sp. L3-i22 TaxID=2836373 RepID=UPI001C75D016|nr:hypothetical protein [Actinoplanes sp. L3-i22]BCY11844.1 hypothetical protein L3i22_069320 [Actinoplanes sp. L3-i22]
MTSRIPAALTALAAILIAAFVVAPGALAGSLPGGLGAALRESFEEYWRADQQAHLQTVVDYWFRYHIAKGAIAALLLGVLIPLGVLITRAFVRSGGPARAFAGVSVGLLALVALVAVMANLQGAIAPLSSLLPMLPGDALAQVAPQLAAGAHPPAAVAVMVDDFARYHVAMAVIAAVLAATFIGATALAGRRFARTEPSDPRSRLARTEPFGRRSRLARAGRTELSNRRGRLAWVEPSDWQSRFAWVEPSDRQSRPARVEPSDRRRRLAVGSFGAVAALLSAGMIVLAVANTSVAINPEPAFQAFVNGGW